MSGKKCWRLFPYWTIDHKAAEVMLGRMAADGWALHRVFFGLFARFKKTERTDLTYSVDLGDPAYKEHEEYLALCAESGWELVGYVRYMNLYASLPGASPAPIQTDGSVECERFRKVVLKRMRTTTWAVIILFAFLFLLPLRVGAGPYWASLRSILATGYMFSFLFFSAPLILAGFLFYWLSLFLRLRAWQALTEAGSPIPVPESKGVRLRCAGTLLAYLYFLLFEFSAVLDYSVNRPTSPSAFFVILLIAVPIAHVMRKAQTERRFAPMYANAYLWPLGLGVLLSFLLPYLSTHPLQPSPTLPDGPIWGAEMKSVGFEGSYLGRVDSWSEKIETIGNSPSFFVQRYSLRGAWMADGVWESLLIRGMEPVPGRTDILWLPVEDSPGIYRQLLLRQGGDILDVFCYGGLPLEEFLSTLDTWQAKSRTGP